MTMKRESVVSAICHEANSTIGEVPTLAYYRCRASSSSLNNDGSDLGCYSCSVIRSVEGRRLREG